MHLDYQDQIEGPFKTASIQQFEQALYQDGFPHCAVRLMNHLKAYLYGQVEMMNRLAKIQEFKYNTNVARLVQRFLFEPCCPKSAHNHSWFQANAVHQLKLLEIILDQFFSVQSSHISYCLLDAIFGISNLHDEVK